MATPVNIVWIVLPRNPSFPRSPPPNPGTLLLIHSPRAVPLGRLAEIAFGSPGIIGIVSSLQLQGRFGAVRCTSTQCDRH